MMLKWLRLNLLTVFTFCGVVLGVALGIGLRASREEPWTRREAMYVSFIGTLFLKALKCIIIPLVVPSLILAVGSLDTAVSGKIGIRAVCYYFCTTVMAIVLGVVLVVSIKPGANVPGNHGGGGERRNITTEDTLMDLIRNVFPGNIIEAATHQEVTVIEFQPSKANEFPNQDENDKRTWAFEQTMGGSNTNMLGLISFSLVFGVAVATVGEEAKALLEAIKGLSEVMMRITTWVIHLAPIGILFLVAGEILLMDDLAKTFASIGAYFGTVMAGLVIHATVVIPIIFGLATKKWPFEFMFNLASPLFTAFGTASSTATLPLTIEILEEKNHIDPRVTRFVLPIGATINMDGTALYEAVAAIFIAQVNGLDLSIVDIVIISITATAASVGAAGIPQAGLVTMVMVLNTVGLPSSDIALILSLDWLIDRFRTAVNVMGDAMGAGVVYHLSKKELGIKTDPAALDVEENEAKDVTTSSPASENQSCCSMSTKV